MGNREAALLTEVNQRLEKEGYRMKDTKERIKAAQNRALESLDYMILGSQPRFKISYIVAWLLPEINMRGSRKLIEGGILIQVQVIYIER